MVISVPSPMISMTVNQINKRPKIKRYVIWSGCFHVAIVKFFTNEKPATLHNIKIYNTYILLLLFLLAFSIILSRKAGSGVCLCLQFASQ